MALKLPKPIAEYLAAVEEKNSNKLAGCFAEAAVVHDEGGTYRGVMRSRHGVKRRRVSTTIRWRPSMPRLPETLSASTLK